MSLPSRVLLAIAVLALAACAPPAIIKPYRIDIQQGNYVSQDMVSQLRPGMTKDQVRYILGTPLITDIFHADRWDYVFYLQKAYGIREERKITVLFDNDGRLTRIEGDVVPAKSTPAKDEAQAEPKQAEPKQAEPKKADGK